MIVVVSAKASCTSPKIFDDVNCECKCPENATCDGETFTCDTGYVPNDTNDGCVLEGTCETNATCSNGYFCKFTKPSYEAKSVSEQRIPKTGTGKCTKVEGGETIAGHMVSRSSMDWFSAMNWCEAQGSTGLLAHGSTIDGVKIEGSFNGLYAKGFEGKYWLSTLADPTSASCYAYYMQVDSGREYVGHGTRNGEKFALCE